EIFARMELNLRVWGNFCAYSANLRYIRCTQSANHLVQEDGVLNTRSKRKGDLKNWNTYSVKRVSPLELRIKIFIRKHHHHGLARYRSSENCGRILKIDNGREGNSFPGERDQFFSKKDDYIDYI
ncbi:8321_t:CDS:2, partial [Rhizophagus irregularis]